MALELLLRDLQLPALPEAPPDAQLPEGAMAASDSASVAEAVLHFVLSNLIALPVGEEHKIVVFLGKAGQMTTSQVCCQIWFEHALCLWHCLYTPREN